MFNGESEFGVYVFCVVYIDFIFLFRVGIEQNVVFQLIFFEVKSAGYVCFFINSQQNFNWIMLDFFRSQYCQVRSYVDIIICVKCSVFSSNLFIINIRLDWIFGEIMYCVFIFLWYYINVCLKYYIFMIFYVWCCWFFNKDVTGFIMMNG